MNIVPLNILQYQEQTLCKKYNLITRERKKNFNSLGVGGNLGRFRVRNPIDAVNSRTNFFFENENKTKFFLPKWIQKFRQSIFFQSGLFKSIFL